MATRTSRFCRIELRTTDADSARAFYSRVLGHDRAVIWTLHEQARARGAPAHWLGHLAVDDVERAATAFVQCGAVRLGPLLSTAGGGQTVVLRDPGGAVIAVSTAPPASAPLGVDAAWYVLNTSDMPRTIAAYPEVFGWGLAERGGLDDGMLPFAWRPGEETVGAVADIAARPGVHPHWLFFFAVEALEQAAAQAREAGGVVHSAFVLPTGERACVADDPQGAAFALCERRRDSVRPPPGAP